MSRATMMFDLQWVLKHLDDLDRFIKFNQLFMAKSTVQRIRETFETYGRVGKEPLFSKIDQIEICINRNQDPSQMVESLRADITNWLRNS